MDFINEQNGIFVVCHRFHHGFQPFFKIATIAGSSKQLSHIQRIDHRRCQNIGNIAVINSQGKPFGDGGFANTRITNIKRIVFRAAA